MATGSSSTSESKQRPLSLAREDILADQSEQIRRYFSGDVAKRVTETRAHLIMFGTACMISPLARLPEFEDKAQEWLASYGLKEHEYTVMRKTHPEDARRSVLRITLIQPEYKRKEK